VSAVEITSLSSKGQVVIPNAIRNDLGIGSGTRFVVISDGENILLRPLEKPKIDTFKDLIRRSRDYARRTDMKRGEVEKAVRKVRNASRG